MAKNNINPNELDLLAGDVHTFPPNTFKANLIQSTNSTFTFESVITKLNQPVGPGVTVYLYHKGLGTLIAKVETDNESKIYVPNLSKHNQYMVVAIDPKDLYNSVIFDVTFDFNSKLFNNTTLKYYNIYDVPNIQKLYPYWNTLVDQRTDPSVLFFISNPMFKDDVDLSWGATGTIKTTVIDDIRTFTFTNSGDSIYLNFNPVPPKSAYTFSAYIYIDSNNRNITTNNNIFRHATQSFYVDSNLKLNFKNTDLSNLINLISTTSIILDKWNHVSISFDESTIYLFLNGILQSSVPNTAGMTYEDSNFYVGDTFKGYLTQPLMNSVCKYTENFDFLLKAFSYKSNVYSDPTDTLAEYVRIKLSSNRLKYGLRDEVTNVAFSSGAENKYFTPITTRTRMLANSKNTNPVLSNKNFCMEFKVKIKSTVPTAYPRLAYNNYEQWTTNSWEFDVNRPDYPNQYSFHSYNVGTWVFTHPVFFNELMDLALVRVGSELKLYVNGFLSQTISIGTGSFDNGALTYLAFGWQMLCHLYDFKLTVGHSRYTANYEPKQLEWLDPILAFNQYQIINFAFKQYSSDSQNVLSFTNSNIVLKTDVSINNTKSAYFNNSKITSNNKLYIINEKFSIEMFYQPDAASLTGVASIISVSGAFRLGLKEGKLSFFNGTTWEDSTYVFDNTKLNHIVLQRNGTQIKLLAEGELVLTTTYTMPAGVKTIVIGCFNDTEYIKGYINNFIMYKNINRYEDTYTVPVEDPVVKPPEDAVPEVIVNQYTTAALDFEDNLVDKIPTTVWTKTGSTSSVTAINKIFGSQSFQMKTLGDSLTLPANHINSNNPYTIDFYMLHNGYTRGSSRTDTTISIFSKNTGGDKYIALSDNRTLQWTVPHVKNESKIPPNEITHYTYTYDGAASRLFINDKLEAIGGGSMDFINGQPLSFGHHEVSGYPNWAFGTQGIWDNFNIHQGIATVVRDKDPNADFLVCDLAFDGPDNGVTFIDNAPSKPTWTLDGSSPTSYIRLTANSTTPKYKTGYSYFNKNYYNNSCIKSTNVDLNFGTDDWTLSFEFIKNDNAIYCNFISSAASNYTTDSEKLFYFCVMGSGYTGIPSLQKKLSFFNEKNLGIESVKNSVIANPYTTTNVLVSRTTIESGIAYKVDVVFKEGVMYLYINNTLDTSIPFNVPIDLSPAGLGTTIGGVPFSNEAGLNGSINYVKAYKGVAIVPEDTSKTILLNFQSDVKDFYSNTTWTSSGISYSAIESVKGSAAVFQTSSTIYSKSALLDFGTGDFRLSYDIKPSESNVSGRYVLTNDLSYMDTSAIWFFGSSVGFDYANKPTNNSGSNVSSSINQYYNLDVIRKGKTLHTYANNVLISTHNLSTQSFDFSKFGNGAYLGRSPSFGVGNSFIGALDNFTTTKDYKKEAVVNMPAVHLPLETNPNSTGYTVNLVTSAVGNPSSFIIDNTKCLKFESGKYVTINSHNIFNLGTNSNFYLEFDFYPIAYQYHVMFSNGTVTASNNTLVAISLGNSTTVDQNGVVKPNCLYIYCKDKSIIMSDNSYSINSWNTVKLFRSGNALTISLNDVEKTVTGIFDLDFSLLGTFIGKQTYGNTADFNGYMSNFKMFLGTSKKPENFNPYTVLNLDFSPTNKSYLFKDKFNKCIIHPVNITQRDYQDSQYCVSLNGTNQSLSLGKNSLLNFGNDDFVLNINFKYLKRGNNLPLICSGVSTNTAGYMYMQVRSETSASFREQLDFTYRIDNNTILQMMHTNTLQEGIIYNVILVRKNNKFTLTVNDIESTSITNESLNPALNFNGNSNTFIGINPFNTTDWVFKGTIYHVKIFRNTSDVSLLENK